MKFLFALLSLAAAVLLWVDSVHAHPGDISQHQYYSLSSCLDEGHLTSECNQIIVPGPPAPPSPSPQPPIYVPPPQPQPPSPDPSFAPLPPTRPPTRPPGQKNRVVILDPPGGPMCCGTAPVYCHECCSIHDPRKDHDDDGCTAEERLNPPGF